MNVIRRLLAALPPIPAHGREHGTYRRCKMSYYRETRFVLLAGATGALILGIVGRMSMAGVALFTGNTLHISMRGVLEVVIVGALVGAAGGILLLVLRRVYGVAGLVRGIIVGIVMFACSVLVYLLNGKSDYGLSHTQLLTVIVAAIIFMVYGICVDALLKPLEGVDQRGSRMDNSEDLK